MVKFAYFLIALGSVLLIVLIGLFLLKTTPISHKLYIDTFKFNDFGSFTAGTTGILWSLAGVVLLVESLREQRRATNENIKQIKVQQFENIFFQLVNAHHQIVDTLKAEFINPTDGTKLKDNDGNLISREGVYFFEEFVRVIKKDFDKKAEFSALDLTRSQEVLLDICDEQFFLYNSNLGHYYGNLRILLLLLKDFKKASQMWHDPYIVNQVVNYSEILSSQLSYYEIVALAYNAILDKNSNLFKLIEEFAILKDLRIIVENEQKRSEKWIPIIVDPVTLLSNFVHLNSRP